MRTFWIMTSSKATLGIDIQLNGFRHNDIQQNDNEHNDNEHNDIQHNDTQHNDTQHGNKNATLSMATV
jgi:hypothetical protein